MATLCRLKTFQLEFPQIWRVFLALTELVLFQRSEKSILVKMTRFCIFQRIFKIFSKFKKSETSNLL